MELLESDVKVYCVFGKCNRQKKKYSGKIEIFIKGVEYQALIHCKEAKEKLFL